MSEARKLHGRHALVTGAGKGIGAAIARRLRAEGARVTLLGRESLALEQMRTELGSQTQISIADVTQGDAVHQAFEAASAAFGPIDILVNNAGQAESAPLHRTDETLWRRMIEVNLTGTYFGMHAVLPGMMERDFGRIVNVASVAGLIGFPYAAAYAAAKHGVVGLTRSVALEVAKKNITVNAVCPGYTETDIVRNAVANIQAKTQRSDDEARQALLAQSPQGRFVQPDEVANAVAWLCLPGRRVDDRAEHRHRRWRRIEENAMPSPVAPLSAYEATHFRWQVDDRVGSITARPARAQESAHFRLLRGAARSVSGAGVRPRHQGDRDRRRRREFLLRRRRARDHRAAHRA